MTQKGGEKMTILGHAMLNAMYQIKKEERLNTELKDYARGLKRGFEIIIENLEKELTGEKEKDEKML